MHIIVIVVEVLRGNSPSPIASVCMTCQHTYPVQYTRKDTATLKALSQEHLQGSQYMDKHSLTRCSTVASAKRGLKVPHDMPCTSNAISSRVFPVTACHASKNQQAFDW